MKRLTAVVTLVLLFGAAALPAAARDYVQDQAKMFSSQAVQDVDSRIATFNQATGKEIVVVTVPSLAGASLQDAAAKAFAAQSVNGVLIFIARDDRRDIIVPDKAGAGWFTPDALRSIRASMEREFRNESYDSGLLFGVDGVMAVYRQHMMTQSGAVLPQPGVPRPAVPQTASAPRAAAGGMHVSIFWWVIIVVVGFLILRSVMRAISAPRYGPPGSPGAMPPGGVPPAGYGPGYGPGYGYGGGGGSFWSGLLGGLGGAWLGNELFGQRGGGAIGPADAAQPAVPDAGGGWGGDAGGWQSDAGQADMGAASSGDWSGGGFGGGDSGGGGDFGGGDAGGGDAGGGW
jgi:uncharacterized membrane protein YgcG